MEPLGRGPGRELFIARLEPRVGAHGGANGFRLPVFAQHLHGIYNATAFDYV